MTTGGQPDDTEAGGTGRAVPDAENYLDLSGVEDDDHGPHFDVVLRGYDRRQVDDHVAGLRRMVAQLRAQLAVRERRREPAAGSGSSGSTGPSGPITPSAPAEAIPAARTPAGDDDGDDLGAFNDRLRGILQAAEQEAQAVRSRAAETLLAEHAESRAALADLRSQRDAVVDELVRLRGWLDEIVSHPGRAPAVAPPVLHPGPPRGAPWSPVPPPGRPPIGPPAGRYAPLRPDRAPGPVTGPASGGFPAPADAAAPSPADDDPDTVDGSEYDGRDARDTSETGSGASGR